MAAFRDWWQFARSEYQGLVSDAPPSIVTMYYDPLLDVHLRVPVASALGNQLFISPLVPEDSRRIFDAAAGSVGLLEDEIPPERFREPRQPAGAWFLAKEFGLTEVAGRIAAGLDVTQQPTWDRERGEFTWGCNLDEEHPRGQFNAWLAAAEANSPGAWTRLATERLPKGEPLVVGVDFPRVALSEARWVDGVLHLALAPRNEAVIGEPTSFRVTGLEDPGSWSVSGPAGTETSVVDGALEVRTVVGPHELQVQR